MKSSTNKIAFDKLRAVLMMRIFKWIGPLAVNTWGLFAKNSFGGTINTLADARPYRIGGVAGDAKVEWLKQQGVPNIVAVKDEKLIPPMLTLDRKQAGAVDLWIASVYAAKTIADEVNVKDLKLVLKAGEQQLWLACNPGVPNDTIKALSAALDAMKKDGAYNKISAAYAKQFVQQVRPNRGPDAALASSDPRIMPMP